MFNNLIAGKNCTCTSVRVYMYIVYQNLCCLLILSLHSTDAFLPSPDSLLINLKECKDVSSTCIYMYVHVLYVCLSGLWLGGLLYLSFLSY